MASTDQLALSDFIKSVHKTLRENCNELGSEEAWKNHCKDVNNLSKYASAMRDLAENCWEKNYEADSKSRSRVLWTCLACENYFNSDIIKYRDKERIIASRANLTIPEIELNTANKWKLLDVGSCYNPFKRFDCFEVIAIDLAPATSEVFKCDFLSVPIGETLVSEDDSILQLENYYFDIVVFSLLLEYLPCPKQRLSCCEKAYSLLKAEGILVIITPDSNHVGVNAKYMKSWRYVLAKLGFSRIKYEKLPNIHCMVFRKALCKEITHQWIKSQDRERMFNEILIPQDFHNTKTKLEENAGNREIYLSNINEFLLECPDSDVFQ